MTLFSGSIGATTKSTQTILSASASSMSGVAANNVAGMNLASASATAKLPSVTASAAVSYDSTTNKIQSASAPGSGTGCDSSSIPIYRYPLDGSEQQDWLKINIMKYKRAGSAGTTGGGTITGAAGKLVGGVGKGDTIASIYLAVPNDINAGNTANWSENSMDSVTALMIGGAKDIIQGKGLGDAITKTLDTMGLTKDVLSGSGKDTLRDFASSSFGAAAVASITGSNYDIKTLLARSGGKAINPNKELLFEGPTLREFGFSFPIIPSSPEEAVKVKDIIRLFKKHSAPKRESKGDFFLSSPDIFELSYMHKGKAHPFLNKFKYCALKSVGINYTGSSVYSTYEDGTPTHMILSLTFGEIEPIFFEDFEGDTGTGY